MLTASFLIRLRNRSSSSLRSASLSSLSTRASISSLQVKQPQRLYTELRWFVRPVSRLYLVQLNFHFSHSWLV